MGVEVRDGVLSLEECKELVAIAKSMSTASYRQHVTSATLDVILATEPALLVPILTVRGKRKHS
jgi:hypothetical protein